MDQDLPQEAISAALKGDWKRAVEINSNILQIDKIDTDAINRLARAYAELGNFQKAKAECNKVLRIDPYNMIATKSLEKWKNLKKGETYTSHPSSAQIFLEEPGKTKIVSLLFLGDAKVLAKLDSADEVRLNTNSHRVSVLTTDNKYIGRLPDDISARIKKLIKSGNEYQVYIKSAANSDVKVFLREAKRDKSLSDIPSFASEKIDYISFTPPELVHKKEDVHPIEVEDTEE